MHLCGPQLEFLDADVFLQFVRFAEHGLFQAPVEKQKKLSKISLLRITIYCVSQKRI